MPGLPSLTSLSSVLSIRIECLESFLRYFRELGRVQQNKNVVCALQWPFFCNIKTQIFVASFWDLMYSCAENFLNRKHLFQQSLKTSCSWLCQVTVCCWISAICYWISLQSHLLVLLDLMWVKCSFPTHFCWGIVVPKFIGSKSTSGFLWPRLLLNLPHKLILDQIEPTTQINTMVLTPFWLFKSHLPFMQAVVPGLQSLANITLLGILHATTRTTQLMGYDIPEVFDSLI